MALHTKSKEAFLFSVQRLASETTGPLFLWTFTFRNVPESDDWALDQWAKACMSGARDFKGVHGLRVCELHRDHGIHFHLLLNQRFPVGRMLEIFWPFGFGRIEVKEADIGAGEYMAKYLTKKGKLPFCGRRRKWGAFGGFRPCRLKDVQVDSPATRNRFLMQGLKFKTAGIRARAYGVLFACSQFGDYREWPNSIKQRFFALVHCTKISVWDMDHRGEFVQYAKDENKRLPSIDAINRTFPNTVDNRYTPSMPQVWPGRIQPTMLYDKKMFHVEQINVDSQQTLCDNVSSRWSHSESRERERLAVMADLEESVRDYETSKQRCEWPF